MTGSAGHLLTARVMSHSVHICNNSSTSCEEWVLAPADLEDDNSSLVVTEQVEELVCELGSPQLDGQSSVESLESVDKWESCPRVPLEGSCCGMLCQL